MMGFYYHDDQSRFQLFEGTVVHPREKLEAGPDRDTALAVWH
jgi:hypothetical protein